MSLGAPFKLRSSAYFRASKKRPNLFNRGRLRQLQRRTGAERHELVKTNGAPKICQRRPKMRRRNADHRPQDAPEAEPADVQKRRATRASARPDRPCYAQSDEASAGERARMAEHADDVEPQTLGAPFNRGGGVRRNGDRIYAALQQLRRHRAPVIEPRDPAPAKPM